MGKKSRDRYNAVVSSNKLYSKSTLLSKSRLGGTDGSGFPSNETHRDKMEWGGGVRGGGEGKP